MTKILLLTLLVEIPAFSNTTNEINHLIKYVKETKCQYIINGTIHNGVESSKHIKAKYDHYKDEIKTTEDFIRLSATNSMLSGKRYYIKCSGKSKIPSNTWLKEELKRYRNK